MVIFAATGNNFSGVGSSYDVDNLVRTAPRLLSSPRVSAASGVPSGVGQKKTLFRQNLQGVGVAAEAAKAAGVQKFVLCSCAVVTGALLRGACARAGTASVFDRAGLKRQSPFPFVRAHFPPLAPHRREKSVCNDALLDERVQVRRPCSLLALCAVPVPLGPSLAVFL